MKITINRKALQADVLLLEKVMNTIASPINADTFWIIRQNECTKMIVHGGIEYLELKIDDYIVFEKEPKDFNICLALRSFAHFVKNFHAEELCLTHNENKSQIVFSGLGSDKNKWSMMTVNRKAPDRPVKYDPTKGFVNIGLNDIAKAIGVIKFAANKDRTKAPMTAINLQVTSKGLILYATDAIRIARYRIRQDSDLKEELRVPSFAFDMLEKLSKYANLSRILCDRDYFVLAPEDERYFYFSPQEAYDKKFPDVGQFFKQERTYFAQCKTEEIRNLLVLIQSSTDLPSLTCELGDGSIRLYGEDGQIKFDTEIVVDVEIIEEEEIIPLKLDARTLLEALSNVATEMVGIGVIPAPTRNKYLMFYISGPPFDYIVAQRA